MFKAVTAECRMYRFWTHYYRHEELARILLKKGLSRIESFENILQDEGTGMNEMVTFYIARKE